MVAGLACASGFASGEAVSVAGSLSAVTLDDPTHQLVLRDGRTIGVRIVEELENEILVEVVLNGISARRSYARSEILSIQALGGDAVGGDDVDAGEAEHRVYVANLVGDFGRDITATSMDRVMKDAAKSGANVVVLYLNSEWKQADFVLAERFDDFAEFDQFFAAERFLGTLQDDVRDTEVWPEAPRVVFWVHRAMGGLAFLPMTTRDVFFTSDGQMGGIGNLDQLFDNQKEAFFKKQQGLRRTAVEGWLIEAGHNPIVGNAMMQRSLVLSYRIKNGKAEFLRNYPETDPGGGWTLLTDDGEDDREDTDAQIVRKQGNDVLTLRAPTALTLGFSKGTVDETEDLLFELGIFEDGVILNDEDGDGFTDSADRVVAGWSNGLQETIRRYQRMSRDLQQLDGPNALSRRINMLQRIIALIRPYKEVLDPGDQLLVNLNLQIEQLRNQRQLISIRQREARRGPR